METPQFASLRFENELFKIPEMIEVQSANLAGHLMVLVPLPLTIAWLTGHIACW
jgi:hypothetical protein